MGKHFAILAWAIGCGGGGAAGPGPQAGGGGGGGGGGGQCTPSAPEQLGNVDDQGQLGVTPLENGATVAFRRDRETIQLVLLQEDGILNKPIWLTSDVRPSIARPPRAVWNGQEYLVAWIEQPPDGMASLRARRVSADGQAVGQSIIGVGNMEITGGADIMSVDRAFSPVWVAGLQLSGIRFASVDPEGFAVRRDTIDLGIVGLEDMRAEAVPGAIQVTWRTGRVRVSAGGSVDGQAEEGNGLSRDDPRTPTW